MRHGKLRQICPYKQKTMEKRNWFKNNKLTFGHRITFKLEPLMSNKTKRFNPSGRKKFRITGII